MLSNKTDFALAQIGVKERTCFLRCAIFARRAADSLALLRHWVRVTNLSIRQSALPI